MHSLLIHGEHDFSLSQSKEVFFTDEDLPRVKHPSKGKSTQPQHQHSLFITCRSNLHSQSVRQIMFHLAHYISSTWQIGTSIKQWDILTTTNCQRQWVSGDDNNNVTGTEKVGSQQSFCPNLLPSVTCSWSFLRLWGPNQVSLGNLHPSTMMIMTFWRKSKSSRLTLVGQDGDTKTALWPAESFGAHNLQQITMKR